MNEMRDELVELIYEARKEWDVYFNDCLLKGKPRAKTLNEFIADYLIENGVVVPPCKVGDKTFLLLEKLNGDYDIVESKCVRITDNGYGKYCSMSIDCKEIGNTLECGICDFGKWVFLTKEDAEQKLKEMRGENGSL
jgi:hypothetical protein